MLRMLFYMNPVLIAAAVVPAVALLIYVYKKDKLESESPRMLLLLLLFGAIATTCAMIAERIGLLIIGLFASSEFLYNILLYFVVVAVSEEGFKYLFLKLRTWKSPEFNCQFDGMVYAVFISLGFALVENITYAFTYGLSTALIRAVTAIPGHACFGVFMGIFYGLAKKYDNNRQPSESKTCRFLALALPILLHGTYDYIATYEAQGAGWIFVGFVAVMFVVSWILVRKMSREDQFI